MIFVTYINQYKFIIGSISLHDDTNIYNIKNGADLYWFNNYRSVTEK